VEAFAYVYVFFCDDPMDFKVTEKIFKNKATPTKPLLAVDNIEAARGTCSSIVLLNLEFNLSLSE
jgi:hypothetical protein